MSKENKSKVTTISLIDSYIKLCNDHGVRCHKRKFKKAEKAIKKICYGITRNKPLVLSIEIDETFSYAVIVEGDNVRPSVLPTQDLNARLEYLGKENK